MAKRSFRQNALSDLIHLIDFPTFFYKKDNFCDFLFAPSPFCKNVYSERKEFASEMSRFVPFRIGPFFQEVISPEGISHPLTYGKSSLNVNFPAYQALSRKGSTLNGKNLLSFLPRRANWYLYTIPFNMEQSF